MDQLLLTPDQTSDRLHTPVATLQYWRTTGRGPRYLKIGRKIFYRSGDIDQFIAACEHVTAGA
ncbi:MAG: helix-turn-helix transcriptional regulator [Croceibacterium sp.]